MIITQQSEDVKKNQILKSAHECFAKRGFDAVTMEEIAKDAGLSKGAVYWYFKSKDDLILELVKNWCKVGENTLYKMALECPLEELIYKYPNYVIHEMDLQHHYKLIFHLWSRSMENELVYKELREAILDGRKKTVAFIKTAITKQLFKAETDADALALTIDALFDGLMIQWHFDKSMDIEKSWKNSIDMLMAGVR